MEKTEEQIMNDELNKIQSWLKTTTEAFDDWDYDGKRLILVLDGEVIETYSRKDLEEIKAL